MDESLSLGLYYRHSGRFSIGGILAALGLGLLAGLVCAWLYAWLIHWNPFVYVNILAAVGFAAVIGMVVESRLESQNCRNNALAGSLALLVALVSYYVSWAVWLHALLAQLSITELLLHPLGMWRVILEVNEVGVWALSGGSRVNGIPLWVVWGAEAVCIVGLAVYIAVHAMQDATYCEGCNLFTKRVKGACFVGAGTAPTVAEKAAFKSYIKGLRAHAAELKRHLEAKDLFYVEQLGGLQPGAVTWYQFDISSCPQCNITNTLFVSQLQRNLARKKSKEKTTTRRVLRQLLLSATEADSIRKLPEKFKTASQTAADSAAQG